MIIKENSTAPDFCLKTDENSDLQLSKFKGKNIVLYFYPKDDTPGCTAEACDFRDNMARLTTKDVVVIGVSKDSVKKHIKFKEKYSLPFNLLSDEEGKVCELYGVFKEKSMYGKTYMGIERSTFLIDKEQKIQKIWRNVKVKGHVDEILESLKSL